jgi:hypothetical protein
MKDKITKLKPKAAAQAVEPVVASTAQTDTLPEEAFLQAAEQEPKRILLADHIKTIITLRDKKRLTFRAIAEWFGERGVETDQSAVYRAYCASIPNVDEFGYPVQDENEDRPIDEYENVTLKKAKG